MSLESVRNGLRDAFKAVHPNWNVYSTYTEVTHVPALVIMPVTEASDGPPAKYHDVDFSGSVRWNLKVLVMVEVGDVASADRTLSNMVSPDNPLSVPAILDARRNREIRSAGIGLVIVKELSKYGGGHKVAGTEAMGAEFKLEVEEE